MNYTNILGIRVPIIRKLVILQKVTDFLNDTKPRYIITLNAEIILKAQHDEEYFYILNNSDLNIIDGSGPQLAARLTGSKVDRFAGADLTRHILEAAQQLGLRVAVVNWNGGLSRAEEIRAALLKTYPQLCLLVLDIDREWIMPYYQKLNSFQPDVLLVSLGAPYQEKFIFHTLEKLKSVRLAIGVGGTFDFYTGKLKRAPGPMRALGLEWLWRLKEQPWRIKRIINAVIVFPYRFILYRFLYPYLYRPNVACLLYKKADEKYYILLVERTDSPGHWQLPQGGRDGLSIETAGIKELTEEVNCEAFKPMATFPDLWKYTFDKEITENKVRRHYGYKGQKQSLLIAEFTGRDENISVNYWDHSAWKWVEAEKLEEEIAEKRKPSAKIFLEKFKEVVKPPLINNLSPPLDKGR